MMMEPKQLERGARKGKHAEMEPKRWIMIYRGIRQSAG